MSLCKESHINAEWDTARKNPERMDWDQKYWCEFKMPRFVHVCLYMFMCLCIFVCMCIYLYICPTSVC